ncbi:MAG: hypothetical protein LKCHEGNO_00843 [Burkholderiaceae bacterium]|nr:hypothetical protein [Burkholderiaceae bacterium]
MLESAVQPDHDFGRFVVRPATRQLIVDGRPARLGARAFDLLLALIARRDRTVAKGELLDVVWPGVVVEENNLQVQISALRKLLGPAVIATVPGRGYRFTADADASSIATATVDRATAQRRGAPAAAPSLDSAPRAPGNLPTELAPLYGRDPELRALVAQIRSHRLVSVVGAGGIGKTRLAQAAAHALRDDFADGVWLVELAALADPALLPAAVAQTLGLALTGAKLPLDELAGALRPLSLLLVLDNGEHLLAACGALAAAVLARAPAVRMLTTTQEALHLPDEQRVPLGPLSLPSEATTGVAARAGAVELFAARAHGVDPRFALDGDNVGAVVDICRRLDGLPLAIELAAARVPLLGVEGLRNRLDDRFRLLTAGSRLALRRHQTLRAALDWSFGLLTRDEQTVFRRLGVFAGSFGLEAAQVVAGDAAAGTEPRASDAAGSGRPHEALLDRWAVLEHLGALVDKSLVAVDPGDEPRYRLLESGRAFALEQLHASGETAAVMQRHAAAMLALFESAYELQWSLPARELRARCLSDLDNLRAALSWAQATPGAAGCFVALAGASAWLWEPAGLRPEGMAWCERAIARVDAHTEPRVEARLALARAPLAFPRVTATEIDSIRRAAELYRATDDRRGLYLALNALAQRHAMLRELPAAQQAIDAAAALLDPLWPPALRWSLMRARAFQHGFAQRSAEAFAQWQEIARQQEAAGEFEGMTTSLLNAADIGYQVDFDAAVGLGRRVVEQMRRDRYRGLAAGFARGNLLGALVQRGGDLDEALELAREAVPLLIQGDTLAPFLDHYALLALRLGRSADAARVLGRSDAASPARGTARMAHEQRSHDAVLALLVHELSAAEHEQLKREGARLGDLDAARLALGDPGGAAPASGEAADRSAASR